MLTTPMAKMPMEMIPNGAMPMASVWVCYRTLELAQWTVVLASPCLAQGIHLSPIWCAPMHLNLGAPFLPLPWCHTLPVPPQSVC